MADLSPIREGESEISLEDLTLEATPQRAAARTPVGGGRWVAHGAPALAEAMERVRSVRSTVNAMASPLLPSMPKASGGAVESSAYWSGWADGEEQWAQEKAVLVEMLEESQRLANAAAAAAPLPGATAPDAAVEAVRQMLKDEALTRRRHRKAMAERGAAIQKLVQERRDASKRAKHAAAAATRKADSAATKRDAAGRKALTALTGKLDALVEAHGAQRAELASERIANATLSAKVDELRALLAEQRGAVGAHRRSNAVLAAEVEGEQRIRAVMMLHERSIAEVEESKRALVASCAQRDDAARRRIDALERDAADRHAQYAAAARGWATREESIIASWEGERAAFEAERGASAEREARILRALEARHEERGAALPAAVAAFHAKANAALAALAARCARRDAARVEREAAARRELAASDAATADALAALRALREDLVDDER